MLAQLRNRFQNDSLRNLIERREPSFALPLQNLLIPLYPHEIPYLFSVCFTPNSTACSGYEPINQPLSGANFDQLVRSLDLLVSSRVARLSCQE